MTSYHLLVLRDQTHPTAKKKWARLAAKYDPIPAGGDPASPSEVRFSWENDDDIIQTILDVRGALWGFGRYLLVVDMKDRSGIHSDSNGRIPPAFIELRYTKSNKVLSTALDSFEEVLRRKIRRTS